MNAPNAVPRLERMDDLVELERAVPKLIQERHARGRWEWVTGSWGRRHASGGAGKGSRTGVG
ncbi:MAG: hypothetical protein KGO50_09735 [Myxococcales bacterium]|nr:hypothetical protein [Myxococcales bacterium]